MKMLIRGNTLLGILACTVCFLQIPASAPAAPNAVKYRGKLYADLAAILAPSFLDGATTLTHWARVTSVTAAGSEWLFENGGNRIRTQSGSARRLRSPVLVIDGRHFIPARECAPYMPWRFVDGTTPTLVYRDRVLPLDVVPVAGQLDTARVGELEPVHLPVRTTRPLQASPTLWRDSATTTLPPGTRLLARRRVLIDGKQFFVATVDDQQMESFLIRKAHFDRASVPVQEKVSHLANLRKRMLRLAAEEKAIDHGPRELLPRTVSLTPDMCWSLRQYEKDFFSSLPALAAARGGEAWATLFMSGRWIEQHPTEMQQLIDLSRMPGVGITWGLHSWEHPKEQPFMNTFSPAVLRRDTLRLERLLLEWGIVPSVFYRFPGLVHDAPRLRTIAGMDLVAVDCDSWVASMELNQPPHRLPATDGSILLVHGNGNERRGIERLEEWLKDNPDIRLAPIHRFVQQGDVREEQKRNPVRPE